MHNIMRKEIRLCASPITYFFMLFGLMFFLPGYPILCGAFFVTLGIYQGFLYAREANDIEFSALLPISKFEIVKGKYLFVCLIEGCSLVLMAVVTLLRMTVWAQLPVYMQNALMTANPFALACALVLFGLFNVIFLRGFFKTAYNMGKPFIIYSIITLIMISVFEALHFIPGLQVLNASGIEHIGLQGALLVVGFVLFGVMTLMSYKSSCRNFEKIDL